MVQTKDHRKVTDYSVLLLSCPVPSSRGQISSLILLHAPSHHFGLCKKRRLRYVKTLNTAINNKSAATFSPTVLDTFSLSNTSLPCMKVPLPLHPAYAESTAEQLNRTKIIQNQQQKLKKSSTLTYAIKREILHIRHGYVINCFHLKTSIELTGKTNKPTNKQTNKQTSDSIESSQNHFRKPLRCFNH